MKNGRMRGISDPDLAAVLQNHQGALNQLALFAGRQQLWNRRMFYSGVLLWVIAALLTLAPACLAFTPWW